MDNEIAINNDISMTIKPEIVKITGMGVRLKKARESMHLSEKEAAARLYLNPRIITVIENEAFTEGPPITFMRGYLRSYARMLNLPENEIKAGLDELETIYPQVTTNKPVLHAIPIDHSDRYIRWITYVVILTLIVLVATWWRSHSKYAIADLPDQTSAFTQENESTTVNNATAATATPAPPTTLLAAPKPIAPTVLPVIAVRDTPVIKVNANPPKKARAAKTRKVTAQNVPVADTKKPEQNPVISNTTNASVEENKKSEHNSVISNMAIVLPESG